jgi:hypothetical protein
MMPNGHSRWGAWLHTARAGLIVTRDASDNNRAAALGLLSMTSTGTPSLSGNLRALRTSIRRMSRGEPDTLVGAIMLNTSYAVVR